MPGMSILSRISGSAGVACSQSVCSLGMACLPAESSAVRWRQYTKYMVQTVCSVTGPSASHGEEQSYSIQDAEVNSETECLEHGEA